MSAKKQLRTRGWNSAIEDEFLVKEICKDMYVLKQAACIASDRIVKLLKSHDYYPLRSNPGIWCHKNLPTKLTLRVENLGIKYANPAHYHHIVNTVQKYYKISINWERNNYCGLNLDWSYDRKYVDVSMSDYIAKALHEFKHPTPKQLQHSPHDWIVPAYGSRVQYD